MGDGKWRGENRGIWNSGVVWFGGRGEGGGSDFGGAWIISPWATILGVFYFLPELGRKMGGGSSPPSLTLISLFLFSFFFFFKGIFHLSTFPFPQLNKTLIATKQADTR